MNRLSFLVQLILLVAIAALGVLVALKNPGDVTLWLGRELTLPIVAVLFLSIASGCLIGLFLASARMIRLTAQNRRLTKRLQATEAEVQNMRSIPINDKY